MFLSACREPSDCSQVDYSTGFPVPLVYYTVGISSPKGLRSKQKGGVDDFRKETDEADLARRCTILSLSCLLLKQSAYRYRDTVDASSQEFESSAFTLPLQGCSTGVRRKRTSGQCTGHLHIGLRQSA